MRSSILLLLGFVLLSTDTANAMLDGGAGDTRNCWTAFEAPGRRLNYPRFPKRPREIRCFDGEAGCDIDGEVDGVCTFDADVCFFNPDSERFPWCTPREVKSAVVRRAGKHAGLSELQAAIDALMPVTEHTCTEGQRFEVPIRVKKNGKQRRNRETLAIRTNAAKGKSIDRLRFTCVPNEWAQSSFDRKNSRSKPHATGVTRENVGRLRKAWQVDIHDLWPGISPPGVIRHNVSAPPTYMDGLVFFPSANGFVYAVDAKTGELEWEYEAMDRSHQQPSALFPGIYSGLTLTADGRLVFGDSNARVHVISQKDGKRHPVTPVSGHWRRPVGNSVTDKVWSTPVVANHRVFVGVASHNDVPCVRGRVVALDLDTGDKLWTTYMVPPNVCDNDLDRECTSQADCGLGMCIEAQGAGITGTPAIDATGEHLYVTTIGCWTFPAMGYSDSIVKLRADTGEIVWVARMNARERIGSCVGEPSTECGSDEVCGPNGPCRRKAIYRDFGFVPGPMLVDVDDGAGGSSTLVVAGAKEGIVYALDDETGSLVWSNQVLPPITFGGQGLFSGALGHDGQKLYAAISAELTARGRTPFHQVAINARDGSVEWTEGFGTTYSAVGVADGLVWSGSPPGLIAQDPATGRKLAEFSLPSNVQGGPTVVDGTVFVGWGHWAGYEGGITAFRVEE